MEQNLPSIKSWREFIVTAYPELARQFFRAEGKAAPTLEQFDGKIEALWRVIPDNYAVIDISSSGMTRKENQITPIVEILTAQLVLYENARKINALEAENTLFTFKKLLSERNRI